MEAKCYMAAMVVAVITGLLGLVYELEILYNAAGL